MKTGWTSLGSAARCPQGRGGWSRGLISCFLHQSVSPLLSFSLSLSFERSEWRNGIIRWTTTEGRKKRRRGKALPYTYSDCRFKCLLITKLVPQPPRSRSLCIFISTSYGRFQEEERRRRFIFIPARDAADRLSPLLLEIASSFWRVLFLSERCMRPRLAGNRHNRSLGACPLGRIVRKNDTFSMDSAVYTWERGELILGFLSFTFLMVWIGCCVEKVCICG